MAASRFSTLGLSRQILGPDGSSPSPARDPQQRLRSPERITHIAPEVLRGESVDQRADLWALGVVLHQLPSGVLPFKRANAFETADAILASTPDALPATVPDPTATHHRAMLGDRIRTHGLRRLLSRATRFTPCASVSLSHRAVPVFERRLQPTTSPLAVIVAGGFYSAQSLLAPNERTPMLAVLARSRIPVEMTAQTFFADGFTEALITALGRIDGVRVIAAGTSIRLQRWRSTPSATSRAQRAPIASSRDPSRESATRIDSHCD